MQAIDRLPLERTQGDARTELAAAVLLGVVAAALWTASYLAWMLLTQPTAVVDSLAAWIG
jgi:hypothetical protein